MKVAVLADTHDNFPDHILHHFEGADRIWHLGDVTDPQVLFPLETTGIPLTVVRGNCDSNYDWPLVYQTEIDGLKIRLQHIPPAAPPHGIDFVVHGHTHIPRDQRVSHCRFLNPGTCGGPSKGAPASLALLTIQDGNVDWQIVEV